MESTHGNNAEPVQNNHSVLNFKQSAHSPKAGEHGRRLKPTRFLRLTQVKEIAGLGKTTLYGMMKAGEFPHSVKIGGRAVGWVEEEVLQWVADRIEVARAMPSQQNDRLAA